MIPGKKKKLIVKTKNERSVLRTVSFKADADVFLAIKRLEDALGLSVRAKRSVAIRRAIIDAVARIDSELK